MAKISLTNVEVLDNPAKFTSKFQFKITFECLEALEEDLEWKLVYVGSAYDSKLDQVLDSVLVGPIPTGRHQFVLDTEPAKSELIPTEDVVGVTVVLLSAFYKDQEFVRIGYFISNEYETEEMRENPPETPDIAQLKRTIVDSDPRITRFAIKWGYEQDMEIEATEDQSATTGETEATAPGGEGGVEDKDGQDNKENKDDVTATVIGETDLSRKASTKTSVVIGAEERAALMEEAKAKMASGVSTDP